MKIILMRHGEAFGYQDSDKTRQLTPLGVEQADKTAEYILAKYQPDMLVSSCYDRAVQTLNAFAQRLPHAPVRALDYITPSDNANKALNRLRDDYDVECLLVVCHMPIVAEMAGILLDDAWAASYALAEVRVIEADILFAGLGTQIDSFVP